MKPNIIFIFSDQQRWDTCGCYGQKLPVTPNLDKMAQQGVRFENAFSCQPVCGPARAALQSGKWPTEVGCHANHRHLPTDLKHTLAKEMKKAGYSTGYIGKWHLASGPNEYAGDLYPDYRVAPVDKEFRAGYDYWLASDCLEHTSHAYDGHMFDTDNKLRFFPYNEYRADVHTKWALDYLDTQKDAENPFFLFISFIEPHHQNDHERYEGPTGSKERFANFEIPGDLAGLEGDWPENYPDYLGCCNSLDTNVGRIRQKLEQMGVDDNTLIIYTSDHGSHFKTRNNEYKRSCHDGCLRIPMIAYGPGFDHGTSTDKLASLIDIPRTILTAGGAEIPEDWRGLALQEAMSDKPWRENIFAQISESQLGRCVRTKRWKYSVRDHSKKGHIKNSDSYTEDFLYDLESDPHERNNLVKSAEHAEIRAQMKEILLREIREAEGIDAQISPAI